MTETIDPEKLLSDLRDLWRNLARGEENKTGLLRACSRTLVVTSENSEDTASLRQLLGVLMRNHPSRAIVLQLGEGAEPQARVFSECRDLSAGRRHICVEGVEIVAGPATFAGLARELRALAAPDLPVIFWCRGSRTFSSECFHPLFSQAQRVIVDSFPAPDPDRAIAVIGELRRGGVRIADLAWTRLTPWREALAHAFESSRCDASQLSSVEIRYGGPPSTSLWYLERWIGTVLPAARVERKAAPGETGLRGISLSGGGAELAVELTGNSVLTRAAGRTARSLMPSQSEIALLEEELSIADADRVFEDLLKI